MAKTTKVAKKATKAVKASAKVTNIALQLVSELDAQGIDIGRFAKAVASSNMLAIFLSKAMEVFHPEIPPSTLKVKVTNRP